MNQDTSQSLWVIITDWAKGRRVVRTAEDQGRVITLTLNNEDKSALIHALMRELEKQENQALRTYRRSTKQLGRQLARAGQRIYDLRCQLEEARSLTTKLDRNGYRGLYAQHMELVRDFAESKNLSQALSKVAHIMADKLVELGEIDTVADEITQVGVDAGFLDTLAGLEGAPREPQAAGTLLGSTDTV